MDVLTFLILTFSQDVHLAISILLYSIRGFHPDPVRVLKLTVLLAAVAIKSGLDTASFLSTILRYLLSNEKTFPQSFFMLTTFQPPEIAASSDALSFSEYANSRTSSS
jgi:hypothetical protein